MSGWQRPPGHDPDATVVLRPPGTPPYPMPPPPDPIAAGRRDLSRLMRILGWAALFWVLLFGGIGGMMALSTQDFLSRAEAAEGTVVRLVERDGSYAPVFRFRTRDGREVDATHSVSSNPPMWRVGQTTRLLYDRDAPQTASPDSWTSLWLFPLIFGGVAALFLIGFVVLRVVAARMAARAGGVR